MMDSPYQEEPAYAYAEYCQELKERGLPLLDFTQWQERMENNDVHDQESL
jgi:hypothetical protein